VNHRMDAFLIAAGIARRDPLTPKQQEFLGKEAYLFLRAGGTISLTEWQQLSRESRDLIAEAGDRIRLEQAINTAAAMQPEVRQAMAEGRDPEDAVARGIVQAGAALALKQLEGSGAK